jgi:GGDEF domain-containing protein
MPLATADGVRLGALCAVDHAPRQWTGRDHGVLEDLAAAVMAELELRRANRRVAAAAAELHFAATHDSLTHVGNRRALMADLAVVLHEQRPATLLMLDLEGMRAFNDAHGHARGDDLLARLTERLEGALVAEGHVYRLGGAHFCALVRGAAAGAVIAAATAAVEQRGDGVYPRVAAVALPTEAGEVDTALRLAGERLAR